MSVEKLNGSMAMRASSHRSTEIAPVYSHPAARSAESPRLLPGHTLNGHVLQFRPHPGSRSDRLLAAIALALKVIALLSTILNCEELLGRSRAYAITHSSRRLLRSSTSGTASAA